ncbi:MAG TPA: PDZ domain-containing protein [Steroidobacteraceae bacterium]|nr:PDZ domain-containing protein [Steroidobacteraceae bacterium]
MRMHIKAHAALLILCLSLAASAVLANDAPAAPAAPAAPPSPPSGAVPAAVPSPAALASPASTDEPALQARLDAAQAGLDAAQQREEAARQRQEAAQERERAALQARLDAARERMEVAAQQLAALSAQMYGPMMKRQVFSGPPHALIGLQLERSSGTAGARVGEVSPGGPAERAGIRSGDVIVAVNGTDVRGKASARRVVELLRGAKPDDKVKLRVLRDGSARDFTVTARPDWEGIVVAPRLSGLPPLPTVRALPPLPPVKALAALGGAPMIIGGPVADMELARLTPGLGRYFGTDTGVLVVRAPSGGALGLQDGDVILSIGGRKPIDSSHVIRILASYDPGEKISMEVMRAHRRTSVTTSMPAGPAMPRVLMMRKDALLGPDAVVSLSRDDRML